MISHDLVGNGWAFPAALTPAGTVALVSGSDELDAALRMIIGTRPGERVMRPQFGCAVWQYLFDPMTPKTLGLIEYAVREAVQQWEPRIDLESVLATVDHDGVDHGGRAAEGTVLITVSYRIRATNDHRNLVFPFYAIPREVRAQ